MKDTVKEVLNHPIAALVVLMAFGSAVSRIILAVRTPVEVRTITRTYYHSCPEEAKEEEKKDEN